MTYSPTRSIENTVAVITGASAGIGKPLPMRWSPPVRAWPSVPGEKTASTLGRVAGYGQGRRCRRRRARAGYNDALIAAAVDKWVTSTPWWRMRGRRLRRHHRPR